MTGSVTCQRDCHSNMSLSSPPILSSRPVVSYDDITLPYQPESKRPQSSKPPLSKKRKWSNQKSKHAHYDPSRPDEPISYNHADGGRGTSSASASISIDAEEEGTLDDEESRELTHEEIWDDSALINAWNAATEEYEAYNGPEKGWKHAPVHKSPL